MKQEFSKSWKGSKQPRKQRKYVAKAPLHLRKKFVNISLSKDLRKKHEMRSIPVRKGDSIKVLRGKFKGKQGKIIRVSLKLSKVVVEGIQRTKHDSSKVDIKMQPSNLQIMELNLEDRKRLKGTQKTEVKEKSEKKLDSKKVNKEKSKGKNAPKKTKSA